MRALLVASFFVLAVASAGCGSGGGVTTVPSPADSSARTTSANGVPGGGGGGGGAAGGGGGGGAPCPAIATAPGTVPFPDIPPAVVSDAPCWFFYFPADPSANLTRPLVDNFGGPQNSVQSAIAIGGHLLSIFSIYNTSKKSTLTFSSISIVGPNAGDFQLDSGMVATAMKGVPVVHPAPFIPLGVTFAPTAEGARTATLQLVSNAGTQLIALNGTGLPNRPVIAGVGGSMQFIDAPPVVSAPKLMQIANLGSLSLVIQSASFGGANPASFTLLARGGLATEDPASLAGFTLASHAMTPEFLIGLSPAAQPGDTATFTVNSNDPLQPSVTTQLSVVTTL
ncbi:MAG: choice-of-anchor domain [Candidatus Eremiobacteraeota bacterium]|nr:choice-of-anchor domain [Candidatus Eremiobacteraeota bacterium]